MNPSIRLQWRDLVGRASGWFRLIVEVLDSVTKEVS